VGGINCIRDADPVEKVWKGVLIYFTVSLKLNSKYRYEFIGSLSEKLFFSKYF